MKGTLPRLLSVVVVWTGWVLGACDRPDPPAVRAGSAPTVGWSAYAGDAGSLRYSTLGDINAQNIGRLSRVWTWRAEEGDVLADSTGDMVAAGRFEATPLAFGDTLVFSTSFNRVIALDGRTGRERWRFDPHAERLGWIGDDRQGFVHRGVATWVGDGARRIFHASRGTLFALDAVTGAPIPSFGDSGSVDLTGDLRWPASRRELGNTSPPAVYRDIVMVGSAVSDRIVYPRDPPGAVWAFDARTGRRLWRWDAVPVEGDSARLTWDNGSADSTGHANVWAPFSVDVQHGLVYLPVSNASNDFYGGNRGGDNRHTQSLVCLDANTGRLVWEQQLVHHGIWDYDPASPPALITTMRNGRLAEDVLLAGKSGFVYVFDRLTGMPVWPMEERTVPPSDVPGERASRTQPHPTWPKPIARQGFSDDDLVDFTPELNAEASALIANRRRGPLFTPPSIEGTLQLPGWIGGAGWGSTAVDPVRQVAFIKATNMPILARVAPVADGRRYLAAEFSKSERVLTVKLTDSRWWRWPRAEAVSVPIIKPPYGTLTAIDLVTGEHRWSIVLGDTPAIRQHPRLKSLHLPPLGVAGAPGGLATASGLLFITGGGDILYAIDSDSGVVRWSASLGQIGYSNPMTYRATDGRQYVVVATGVGWGASLQAFALPDGR